MVPEHFTTVLGTVEMALVNSLAQARQAWLADALTVSRGLAALALIPLVWTEMWPVVGVVLSSAWLSDFLDGRLARGSGGRTRLGHWDVTADTAVGAGLVVGLMGNGTLPWLGGVAVIVIVGALYLAGNLAASMIMQLTGYVPTLFILYDRQASLWWLPPITAGVIALIDWRRLLLINIPSFIRGVAGRFENRHHEAPTD